MAKTTTRVQLELPPKAMETLRYLKDVTEAASYSEVIRAAMAAYLDSLTSRNPEHQKRATGSTNTVGFP